MKMKKKRLYGRRREKMGEETAIDDGMRLLQGWFVGTRDVFVTQRRLGSGCGGSKAVDSG